MGAWVLSLLGVASVVGCVGDSDFFVELSVDCSEDQEDESLVNSGHFRLSSSLSIQQFVQSFRIGSWVSLGNSCSSLSYLQV